MSNWTVAGPEPAGGDEKVWLSDEHEELWLFKPVTSKPDRRQGEDWSEYLAARVAHLLGIPAAQVEMARRHGVEGCVSRNVRPKNWTDQPGSVLLAEVVEGFDKQDRDRRGHSLTVVQQVLSGFGAPPGFDGPPSLQAFEVFAGYLVFDALIANQDRHSDNWSVLLAPDGTRRLMASYDHASSLGFNLTDEERHRRLHGLDGVATWVSRGRATRFEHGRSVSLVDLAARGLALAGDQARDHWRRQLLGSDARRWTPIVESTRVMSDLARSFVLSVLDMNRRRLLDVC